MSTLDAFAKFTAMSRTGADIMDVRTDTPARKASLKKKRKRKIVKASRKRNR